MNWFVILGCVGGICCLVDYIIQIVQKIIQTYKKYHKYKRAYDRQHMEKPAMGFKTEKEQQAEIEARMARK